MITLDDSLRSRLGLTSDSVQIQVCSDYNFHSEEEYKINYWVKVIETFSSFSNLLGPVSPSTIRIWWNSNVHQRSLPGLEKVLYQSLVDNKKLISLTEIISNYHRLYRPVSNELSSTGAVVSSIPRKAISLIGSLARGVWNQFVVNSLEDDEQSLGKKISAEETLLVDEKIEKFTQNVLNDLSTSSTAPLLITDDDVLNQINRLVEKSSVDDVNIHGINEGYPFCRITASDMVGVVTVCLVQKFSAIPFIAGDNIKCLKIFRGTQKTEETSIVTEMDKAYIVSRAAIARLSKREEELHKRWSAVETTIREHLKYGRKNLALTALRERKMVEKQIDDVQIYKLKLEESSSVTETAVMQKIVVDAISETSKAGKVTLKSIERNVQDVVDEANELREQVDEVANVISGGVSNLEDDESVNKEYEKMVREMAQDKEKGMEERLAELSLPSVPVTEPTASTRAPQIQIEDS